jgi:hypothetical protein
VRRIVLIAALLGCGEDTLQPVFDVEVDRAPRIYGKPAPLFYDQFLEVPCSGATASGVEVALTLHRNGTFELTVDGEQIAGAWKVEKSGVLNVGDLLGCWGIVFGEVESLHCNADVILRPI